MNKYVILFRGGAPDKIQLYHCNDIRIEKLNNKNLVDISIDQIEELMNKNIYLLPADEFDILKANEVYNITGNDQSHILLPQVKCDKGYKVINYNDCVPKDSLAYKNLTSSIGVYYPKSKTWLVDDFKMRVTEIIEMGTNYKGAIKGTVGSGSRTVWLINKDGVKYGGRYYDRLTPELSDEIFQSVMDDYIIEQELIPFEDKKLKKVNVDFIIKNGKLLGYKWDEVDQKSLFTNWDQGFFRDNDYIRSMMNHISDYLVRQLGIQNAIMNFEAFSDMKNETWLVEFNWRYSNSMFEWSAVGIDPIACYLNDIKCFIDEEYLNKEFKRYWKCGFTEDLIRR